MLAKSEGRNPITERNPKAEMPAVPLVVSRRDEPTPAFSDSGLFRISDFGSSDLIGARENLGYLLFAQSWLNLLHACVIG
jgi:hypothetical protein